MTEMAEMIEEETNGGNRVRSDRLLITGGSENWPSRPSDMSCMKNALECSGLKYGLPNSGSQVNGKSNNLDEEIGKIIQ